jgi:hypothetical protein
MLILSGEKLERIRRESFPLINGKFIPFGKVKKSEPRSTGWQVEGLFFVMRDEKRLPLKWREEVCHSFCLLAARHE